jgi:hypothetical protein
MARGQVGCDLGQALLPAGLVGVTLCGIVSPVRNGKQCQRIGGGKGAVVCILAAPDQPYRQSRFPGGTAMQRESGLGL